MKLVVKFMLLFILCSVIGNQVNIRNCQDLQDIRLSESNSTFFLLNNIDCEGFNFTTIGNESFPFLGKTFFF